MSRESQWARREGYHIVQDRDQFLCNVCSKFWCGLQFISILLMVADLLSDAGFTGLLVPFPRILGWSQGGRSTERRIPGRLPQALPGRRFFFLAVARLGRRHREAVLAAERSGTRSPGAAEARRLWGGRAGAGRAASRGIRVRKGRCSVNFFQAARTDPFRRRNLRRVARGGAEARGASGAGLTSGWTGKETYAVREGERRLWAFPDSASHRLPNWKPRMASKGPAASASTESSSAGGTSGNSSNGDSTGQDSTFECNICLDTAKDAVISLCGHLFCWPCLHQWLETRPNRQVCPVCKAGISRDKVIPLYGRGSTGQQDPREKTPPRPQGQRPEPENRGGFQGFGFGDGGFQMSFGIGAFPFGIFATAFNINDGRPPPAVPGTPQYVDEQFLSRLFLFVALVIMFWLLIA